MHIMHSVACRKGLLTRGMVWFGCQAMVPWHLARSKGMPPLSFWESILIASIAFAAGAYAASAIAGHVATAMPF